MSDQDEKVRENRARRAAQRQGLRLIKARRRDRRAMDYGGYMLIDAETDAILAGELNSPRALSLNDVERYLRGEGDDDGR